MAEFFDETKTVGCEDRNDAEYFPGFGKSHRLQTESPMKIAYIDMFAGARRYKDELDLRRSSFSNAHPVPADAHTVQFSMIKTR